MAKTPVALHILISKRRATFLGVARNFAKIKESNIIKVIIEWQSHLHCTSWVNDSTKNDKTLLERRIRPAKSVKLLKGISVVEDTHISHAYRL